MLNFSPMIQVTRHELSYGPSDLLVEVGSALGLWFGLSALDLYALVAFKVETTVLWLKAKVM